MSADHRVYVCHNIHCLDRGVRLVWQALQSEVAAQRLGESCELIVSGCQGRCENGPNVNVFPQLVKYIDITPELARRIVREHLVAGRPVAEARLNEEHWS